MILQLEIQGPLWKNSVFFYPDILQRIPKLRNIKGGVFKHNFDIQSQSYVGASFFFNLKPQFSGLLNGVNNGDTSL